MDSANDANAAAAGTAASAEATTAATANTTTTTAATTDEPANPSKREWADFHKTMREQAKTLSAIAEGLAKQAAGSRTEPSRPAAAAASTPAQTTPADAGVVERLAAMERDVALKGTYADLGIKAGPQRDFIEASTKGMPAEAIKPFIEAYLKTLPAPATATASVVATTNPVTPAVNTGAAGGNGAKPDTGDLASIDPATLASLPIEERMKRYEEYRSRGPNSNPYAGARTRQLARTGRK